MVTLGCTFVATVLLFPVLAIALGAIDEGPLDELRSHTRAAGTWPVGSPDEPPLPVEKARDYAVRYCRLAGVDSLARSFYEPPVALIAAHEYAEQGSTDGPYMEALFWGCLAGLMTLTKPSS